MFDTFKKGFAAALSVLALFAFLGGGAKADTYPSKPITVIIPFGAGGSHDVNARIFTSVIPTYLEQAMIVKLMPGASGQKATAYASKVKADGYTVLFTHNFIDQLQQHVEKLPYDTIKGMKTVWKLNDSPALLFVRADKPWKTLPDLLADAKARPGKLTFANSGKWGASFTPGAILFAHADVKVKFIPYKGGGPSRRSILSGDSDFTFGRIGNLLGLQKAGKIRILGVAGDKRLEAFPDVPSFKEMGYPASGALMDRIVMAPSGTPQDHIDKLRGAFKKLYADKTFQNLMKSLGENLNYMDGPDYEKVRLKQTAEYGQVVKRLAGQ